jgi:nucleotide-binding universal stress UspA family protein
VSSDPTSDIPFVHSILHPTDFSEDSRSAFLHALAIAVVRKAELTLLHAGEAYLGDDDWKKFPEVRETLQRWGLIEPGNSPSAVFHRLGFHINKVSVTGSPVDATMEFLEDNPTDLMVLATEGREGLPRLFHGSTAEQLGRAAGIKTLFVPHRARGFVSADGDVTLRRILVPLAQTPDPRPALVYAGRAAVLAGGEPVELLALHIGRRMPGIELPPSEDGSWTTRVCQGDVVDEIVRAAGEADVIFMATDGRNSLWELLAGSHTERVVRRAPCPVAAIPQD